eukprot:3369457-Amphidinium_carterae.1
MGHETNEADHNPKTDVELCQNIPFGCLTCKICAGDAESSGTVWRKAEPGFEPACHQREPEHETIAFGSVFHGQAVARLLAANCYMQAILIPASTGVFSSSES